MVYLICILNIHQVEPIPGSKPSSPTADIGSGSDHSASGGLRSPKSASDSKKSSEEEEDDFVYMISDEELPERESEGITLLIVYTHY